MGAAIEVFVNGDRAVVDAGTTITSLIEKLDEVDPDIIVVRNDRCVYSRDYGKTVVEPGDRLELIHPAFGG